MTEAQWLACAEPLRMLDCLGSHVSARKRRLLGVACCRRVWNWMTDARTRRAVEVAERYADGLATLDELAIAEKDAQAALAAAHASHNPCRVAAADAALCLTDRAAEAGPSRGTLDGAASAAAPAEAAYPNTRVWQAAWWGHERRMQAHLLRELVGNPFRPSIDDPAWQPDGTVVAVARRIYEERDFAALPILADALMDAGCTDDAILNHCRKPGVHVRGCWVIDLLLGQG